MISYEKNQSILLQHSGRLDQEGGVALSQQFAKIDPRSHRHWVLDLTHVDFIDSAGLTALIAGLNRAVEHQCRFVLHNPHPSVKLVLEITRLDQVFDVIHHLGEMEVHDLPLAVSAQPIAA